MAFVAAKADEGRRMASSCPRCLDTAENNGIVTILESRCQNSSSEAASDARER